MFPGSGQCSTSGTACFANSDCPAGETCLATQGLGACRVRFRTSNEFNCPVFQIIYRSPFGDRATGAPTFNCAQCTNGNTPGPTRTTFYGGTAGALVKSCHGGNNIFVQAVRVTNPAHCAGKVFPKSVVGHHVEIAVPRAR